MAHELNYNEERGTHSFVINAGQDKKDVAWHNLGQVYDRPLTVVEALQGANADFNVRKDMMLHITPEMVDKIMNGEPINHLFTKADIVSSHGVNVREDNHDMLGVVGSSYTVVQNKTGFEFIDVLCNGELGSEKPFIETAGVLGKGERIFITAKMPTNLRIGDSKDEIMDYILFTNSHDGSSAVTAFFTPVRVVCNNTLNYALSTARNKVTFRHTPGITNQLDFSKQEQIEMVRGLMNVHEQYKNELTARLAAMAKEPITPLKMKELVAQAILTPEQLRALATNNMNILTVDEISAQKKNVYTGMLNTIESGVGQELWRGSKLWVANGITTYFQNHKDWKDNDNRKKQESKLSSLVEGEASKVNQKVFDLLLVA